MRSTFARTVSGDVADHPLSTRYPAVTAVREETVRITRRAEVEPLHGLHTGRAQRVLGRVRRRLGGVVLVVGRLIGVRRRHPWLNDARLQEPDGPEIVLVLPRNADGWLEQKAMDGARRALLHLLWDADVHGRFGAYYPVTEGGNPIYVHAKVVVMDESVLRIGSSNLNNRSMGFDTECDLAIEAAEPGDRVGRAELALLAEHLGVDVGKIEEATADGGSLLAAVERFRGPGRSLRPFEPATVDGEDSVLAESSLADPERAPRSLGRRLQRVLAG